MCVVELDNRGCDMTLLFWLRQARVLAANEFGRDLLGMLRDIGVKVEWFGEQEFYQPFFQELRTETNRRGVKPVNPGNFVVDCGIGGKERALSAWRERSWPRPHQTYCFQTRGDGWSMFFVFQCWQDGVMKAMEILENRGYELAGRFHHVGQVYEHCWGDTRVSRLLIDWEVETPWLGGKRTTVQVRETAREFPLWFVGELRRIGALDEKSAVKCVVKDKTRAIAGGDKVSFHFIFGIAGFPKGSHSTACFRVLGQHLDWMKAAHERKSFAEASDTRLSHPVIGVDWRTITGSHGFSTPLSRKKDDDPVPIVAERQTLTRVATSEALSPSPLGAMYLASYTTPWADCVGYCPSFADAGQARGLGVFGLPRGVEPLLNTVWQEKMGRGGPPRAGKLPSTPGQRTILPPWAESAFKGRSQQNTSLPCLQVLSGVIPCYPRDIPCYPVLSRVIPVTSRVIRCYPRVTPCCIVLYRVVSCDTPIVTWCVNRLGGTCISPWSST